MLWRGVLLVVGGLLLAACASSGSRDAPAGRASEGAAPAGAGAARPGDGTGAGAQALIPVQASFSAIVMSQSPIAIAKEAGYFEEQGLDANVVSIRSSAQNAAALLTGEVDVSVIGGIGPIRARLSGSDLVLIGATKPYFAGAIVARPDIASPADLRGKRVGIGSKGGNPDFMARAMLPRLGLEPDRDVALFSTGGDAETVAALVAGSVDAGPLIPPGDEQARNLGFRNLVDITAARVPFAATVLATSNATLASRPDALESFLRAYAQAVHRFLTDRDFALRVGASFTARDDVAATEQAYEVERQIMQADLDLPLSAIQAALDLMRADDPRAAEARPEDFVDLRLLQRIKQSGFLERLAAGQPAR